MGKVFRFKQFEVDQEGSTMKINTDGVLLGAMVESITPNRILDVGTGTGVIAMMLAQRFPKALVDAVEIDSIAAEVARRNFKNSIFNDRLHVVEGSFESLERVDFYDLIVSNPPFYTNSLHNPDLRKKSARHTDLDFFRKLLLYTSEALVNHGVLQVILPTGLAVEIKNLAKEHNFSLISTISIRSFVDDEIIRQILFLEKNGVSRCRETDFVIYSERGVYSSSYVQVLKPFFLAF